MTLAPETRFGPYVIIGLIGAGGMGEVYRARDPELARDVAIKVLASFTSVGPESLRRFEQEARATAALNHPNILAIFQMGILEGAPYVVSELLEGGTLREQLKGGPLPLRKAIEYASQVARGLAAAHGKGIVHRDLKPENLFITKDGRVKILDFGLAKLIQPASVSAESAATVSGATEPGLVMGTAGYMSPEQVRGEAADHRADIFAFGAVLYEMVAGQRAFRKPTSAETMAAILNESPEPTQSAANMSPALNKLIHRCLEKAPEQRFQSASDLAFALESLSEGGISAAVPLKARARKSSIWIAAVASLVMIAAALTLWWAHPSGDSVVESITQVTRDGQPKPVPASMASDGSRIYFQERRSGSLQLVQTSAVGGETAPLNSSLINPVVQDIAPDSSALLIKYGTQDDTFVATLPLPAGQARNIVKAYLPNANNAAFFPDGQRIVYCDGSSVYIARTDGTGKRKILDFDGCSWPAVSPDGRQIRFTSLDTTLRTGVLWEVSADQAQAHPQRILTNVLRGVWTQDGKFFIFERNGMAESDIWALPERHGSLSFSRGEPVRLTNGPLSFDAPLPSHDGKRIFAIGYQNRGELIRYDLTSKQFLPVLDGLSATDASFSADGKWLIYLSYPSHDLWRSRGDGSERLQLTYPPLTVLWPHLSPDAKKVEFLGLSPTQGWGTYIADMAGGEPKRLVENYDSSGWSLDGKSVLVAVPIPGEKTLVSVDTRQLAFLDIESGRTTPIPKSEGKTGAFQLTQQIIVASGEGDKLYWFDRANDTWSVLDDGPITNYMISPDSKYLYFVRETPGNPQVMRIHFPDRKIETVASLQGVRRVADPAIEGQSWLGVSPDGSILMTRDTGTQEIYALNMKWP